MSPSALWSIDPGAIGGGAQAPIRLQISGPDYALLRELADRVTADLAAVPQLSDVNNTLEEPRTEVIFRPNRAALGELVEARSPTSIQRVDRMRTVEIEAQIGQGALTDAVGAIQTRMEEVAAAAGLRLADHRRVRELR